jgi:Uma2 family endonuclease
MKVRTPPKKFEMISDLLARLGGISPTRICLNPPPGKATEKDLIRLHKKHGRVFELVEGTLVEKPVGFEQSFFAANIIGYLFIYLRNRPIGRVYAPDAMLRLMPGLVRLPDVCFLTNEQVAAYMEERGTFCEFGPALAVEVLSPSNTEKEMDRKRQEYFRAGTGLVWIVDESKRTVEVWTSPDECVTLTEDDTLDGSGLLPGFRVALRDIFVDPPKTAKRRGKKRGGQKNSA